MAVLWARNSTYKCNGAVMQAFSTSERT